MERETPPPYIRRFLDESRALVKDGRLSLEAFVRLRNVVWPERRPIDLDELRAQIDRLRTRGSISVWWVACSLVVM